MTTIAAFLPFAIHPGTVIIGRSYPYPAAPQGSLVPATNGKLPAELGPTLDAYSTPSLPLIPEQACHPFQTKAATDSRAKLPPWQMAPEHMLEPPDAG